MALDLSKIKGISDEVKAKLAKTTNKDEFDALVKAENLTAEQLNELSGGDDISKAFSRRTGAVASTIPASP